MKSAVVLIASALALSAVACKNNKPADGPAEKAGEAVDEAAGDVKEGAEEVEEAVEDGMK